MPTPTPQGAAKSGANFQECLEPCFQALWARLKAWLEEFLLHAHSEHELLDTLRDLFLMCRARRLIAYLGKSGFFLREVVRCGRLIDADGVRFHPCKVEDLSNCSPHRLPENSVCMCTPLVKWKQPSPALQNAFLLFAQS